MQYNNKNNLPIAIELGYSALQLTKIDTENTKSSLDTIRNVLSKIEKIADEKNATSLLALTHWMSLNTEHTVENEARFQQLLQEKSFVNWLIVIAQLLRDYDTDLLPNLHNYLTKPDWPISPSPLLMKSIADWIQETRNDSNSIQHDNSAVIFVNAEQIPSSLLVDSSIDQDDTLLGRHVFEEVDKDILEKDYNETDAELIMSELPSSENTLIIATDKTDILYNELGNNEEEIDFNFLNSVDHTDISDNTKIDIIDAEEADIQFIRNTEIKTQSNEKFDSDSLEITKEKFEEITDKESIKKINTNKIEDTLKFDSDAQNELHDFSNEVDDIVMSLSTIAATSGDVFSNIEEYKKEVLRLSMLSEISSFDSIKVLCNWCIENLEYFEKNRSESTRKFIESNEVWTWIEAVNSCIVESDEISHLSTLMTEINHSEWKISLGEQELQDLLLFLRDPLLYSDTHNIVTEALPVKDENSDNSEKPSINTDDETENSQRLTSGLSLKWDENTHPELLEIFLEETSEQINDISLLIQKLSVGTTTHEERKTASRMAHTIKGGSAVVGIEALSEFAYKLEQILDYSVNHEIEKEKTDLLVEASKCLTELFDAVQNSKKEPSNFSSLLVELTNYAETLEEEDDQSLDLPSFELPDFIKKNNSNAISSHKNNRKEKNKKLEEVTIQETGIKNTSEGINKLDNSDDINSFNMEVDDIVMTLASISVISEQPLSVINDYKSELERLDMLAEISGYPEISKLSQWCQANLTEFTIHKSKKSEAFIKSGECWTWIELVGTCLNEPQEIAHISTLSTELLREEWLKPILTSDLESLLLTLREAPTETDIKTNLEAEDKIKVEEKIKLKTSSKKAKANSKSKNSTARKRKNIKIKEIKAEVTKKITSTEIISWDKDVHPELLDIYFQETPDQITEVAQLLHLISEGKAQKSDLQLASRIAHTIKGASGVLGIDSLVELTHKLEDILDYSISNKLPSKTSLFLSEASDCLEGLFENIQEKKAEPKELSSVIEELTKHVSLLQEKESGNDNKTTSKQKPSATKATKSKLTTKRKVKKKNVVSKVKPKASPQTTSEPAIKSDLVSETSDKLIPITETHIRVPVDVIDRLLNIAGELVTTSAQVSDQLQKTLLTGKQIKLQDVRVHKMLDELSNTISKQEKEQSNLLSSIQSSDLDTLEMDTYNELHSVTGLLTESILDSEEIESSISKQLNALNDDLRSLKKLNTELSDVILSSRMVSVNSLVPRLERIVRQTCRKTEKQAVLNITGKRINIDTDILNGLVDPLLHLLRNSIDHGIESSKIRSTKKKPKEGKINLDFKREGNHIIMTLKDDGAGINPDVIYQKAIKKGLITPDTEFSKKDILKLILHPGFTTQSKISDISGRGVGMDVVNTAVERLKGELSIDSEVDTGTTIELKIPLTLVTSTTLLVKASGNPVAIPSNSIEQLYYLTPEDLITNKDGYFILHEDKELKIIPLTNLLGWPSRNIDFTESHTLLIIKSEEKSYAVHVDEIIYSREVVIKKLSPWINTSKGISGACHLNDGAVAPVLNITRILTQANNDNNTITTKQTTQAEIHDTKSTPQILVVDDSLSNRKALSLIIEQTKYDVITAVDGLDALQIMNENAVDMVFTDLEMPRMNGLEFTQAIRAWDDKKNIPVIMITSRTTSKHRELAEKAGVDDYLTKPVVTETLLESMQTWLIEVETV
ncbi:MAG: Hpt domain-containing protein [Cocleimonas sp.]